MCEFRGTKGLAPKHSGRVCRAVCVWLAAVAVSCHFGRCVGLGGSIYARPADSGCWLAGARNAVVSRRGLLLDGRQHLRSAGRAALKIPVFAHSASPLSEYSIGEAPLSLGRAARKRVCGSRRFFSRVILLAIAWLLAALVRHGAALVRSWRWLCGSRRDVPGYVLSNPWPSRRRV